MEQSSNFGWRPLSIIQIKTRILHYENKLARLLFNCGIIPEVLVMLHILQVFSTTTALLKPCIPPLLNYLQFHAIIFHSAHVLFAFLLPPPGTRCHRLSVIVHHLLVFGTTSKHTISVLPSPPSDT